MSETLIRRNEKGHFLKGFVANPNGEGGRKANCWVPYGLRAKHWLNKLTRAELEELARDKQRLGKLSSWDAMIITNIVGTMSGNDKGRERERLLDRIEGKPVQFQKSELTGADGGAINVNVERADVELVKRWLKEAEGNAN